MMDIRVEQLDKSFGDTNILQHISLSVANGEFVGVIGPNGSGKSTLLKCIYRVLKFEKGAIFIGKDNLRDLSIKETALRQAVLAQHNTVSFDLSVFDIVLMGRSPYKHFLEQNNETDYEIARKCLQFVGMLRFARQAYNSLSGGEKQRVMLARALAQQTPCLILDEPTNHLDIKYQLQILDRVKKTSLTVIAALHDLNIAAAYCDRLIAMKNGKILREGTPCEVLTNDFIYELYEVHSQVIHLSNGSLVIAYHSEKGANI